MLNSNLPLMRTNYINRNILFLRIFYLFILIYVDLKFTSNKNKHLNKQYFSGFSMFYHVTKKYKIRLTYVSKYIPGIDLVVNEFVILLIYRWDAKILHPK